jgi:hypothetical protein
LKQEIHSKKDYEMCVWRPIKKVKFVSCPVAKQHLIRTRHHHNYCEINAMSEAAYE